MCFGCQKVLTFQREKIFPDPKNTTLRLEPGFSYFHGHSKNKSQLLMSWLKCYFPTKFVQRLLWYSADITDTDTDKVMCKYVMSLDYSYTRYKWCNFDILILVMGWWKNQLDKFIFLTWWWHCHQSYNNSSWRRHECLHQISWHFTQNQIMVLEKKSGDD